MKGSAGMTSGIGPDRATGKVSSETVRELLFSRGATVVGFAPASRFEGAPAGHCATDMIPGARSVIVMGIKLVSTVVNWPQLVWEKQRQAVVNCWQVYDHGGFYAVNMRLEQMGMELAVAFEVGGHEAIFFSGSSDMTVTELNALRLYEGMVCPQPLDEEKLARLAPDLESPTRYTTPFSFRHAAVAAGLGTFGANNLALHPVFGPRIRWSVVITELEMDRYEEPLKTQVCLYDKGCRACINTCPYNVFHEVVRFEYAGQDHPWSVMRGKCYYSSIPCGGTCIQTCPAGTGDKKMKKAVAKRFSRSLPGGRQNED